MSKMTLQESVMNSIGDLFYDNTLVSISGKAGTGKSSLALFLAGSFLTSQHPYEGSCIWIQASESFSKKRLHSLFGSDNRQLAYLSQNIFVTPNHGPFTSYSLQLESLKKLSKEDYFLPPDVKFIIVDNISHHLRYKFSRIANPESRSSIINTYYDTVLTPLIFRCNREGINLILIHEVSFDVNSQKTRPFFSKLYDRLGGVHITLVKSFNSNQRVLKLTVQDLEYSFKFNLANNGFIFSK